MTEIPDVVQTLDGRTLLMGMDPTMTLCSVCGEVASPDYNVIINVHVELGRLTHARCLPDIYEDELLGETRNV